MGRGGSYKLVSNNFNIIITSLTTGCFHSYLSSLDPYNSGGLLASLLTGERPSVGCMSNLLNVKGKNGAPIFLVLKQYNIVVRLRVLELDSRYVPWQHSNSCAIPSQSFSIS